LRAGRRAFFLRRVRRDESAREQETRGKGAERGGEFIHKRYLRGDAGFTSERRAKVQDKILNKM
jgi:hypothetical protein